MSKIIQFSTIGALMAGHLQGEWCLNNINHQNAFGLGCSELINGELTIFQGNIWEGTAKETLHSLNKHHLLPFIQLTEFNPEKTCHITNINHHNIEKLLNDEINSQNIFLAICIEAIFEEVTFRQPQRATKNDRQVSEIAASQLINTSYNIQGRLIGFWTPELYGRISVPGFHFHFIDDKESITGHVLGYKAKHAILSFEEKQTIEITNPTSQNYKQLKIDVTKLDHLITKIEK